MSSSNWGKYLAPTEQSVFYLDCKKAFESLTSREKFYAHHMSQASWYGSLICLFQTSDESPVIFQILQQLFHRNSFEDLLRNSERKGITKEDFHNFLQYCASFYGNMGNYLSFGDTKFIPRIPKEKFRLILSCSEENETSLESLLSLFDHHCEKIYSLDQGELSLGMDGKGITTYYSPNVSSDDVAFVRSFMHKEAIIPYNTRLWKHGEKQYELKIASASNDLDSKLFEYQGATIRISFGDHSKWLSRVVEHLKEALKCTANNNQTQMIEKYILHFTSGNMEDHKDSQRFWIKDIGPVVETNIGFIESYRDPQGERGEFEGFVAIVNKEVSLKFQKLVNSAEQFIEQLPWGKAFEKDKFFRPDFTSLEVLTFASSGVPSGINIPNYDDIRATEGFKNVSLGNVIAARSKDPIEFIPVEDQKLYDELEIEAFEVQVGIHELLGHGTGKLFIEDEHGNKNFPSDLINPMTGKPISRWYKYRETWDSQFQSWASTMEECRAEACGIYLCTNKHLLSLFGHSENAENIIYINWLIMARAGLRALEFYSPELKKWGQAHMQARFVIMRILLEAGEDLLRIRTEKDNVMVVLQREKIHTIGIRAIGDFLKKLQIYKSTGDVENGVAFYAGYSNVSDDFLSIRELVLARKKPRRVFVQPCTFIDDNGLSIVYQEFPATVEGLIRSFVRRFAEDDI